MKTLFSIIFTTLIFINISYSQTSPHTSSKSAAQYDATSIDENIADDRDAIYFSQLAIERGTKAETKDAATDMLADFTGLLYSMEQLAAAGGKSVRESSATQQAKDLNELLTMSRGFSFDTAWIGGMLRMHQVNLVALTEQKATATNERLKAAVTEAIPVLKKYITRLNSLQKQLVRKDLQEKKEAARQQKEAELQQKKKR
jgi:predicted outer membrane protein